MRTRNTDSPKSAGSSKKTPPSRKSAAKTPIPPKTTEPLAEPAATETPKAGEPKRPSVTRAKQVKAAATATASMPSPSIDSKLDAAVEEVKTTVDAAQATAEVKTTPRTRIVKRVVKKVIRKTTAKAAARQTALVGEAGKEKIEEAAKEKEKDDAKEAEPLEMEAESAKEGEKGVADVKEDGKDEEPSFKDKEEPAEEDQIAEAIPKKEEETVEAKKLLVETDVKSLDDEKCVIPDFKHLRNDDPVVTDGKSLGDQHPMVTDGKSLSDQDPMATDARSFEDQDASLANEEKESKEEENQGTESTENEKPSSDAGGVVRDTNEVTEFGQELNEHKPSFEISAQEVHEEIDREEVAEDDMPVHGEEAQTLEEQAELVAAAKERRKRKELEIFVGGLDRDAMEEDVKRVFQNVGEVVDVRLNKDPSTSKNKGYAFVRFATKEQAKRALAEMRNPVIRGKRCGTAPSEDNDTLFLGNICNTWTKEAINQKLKDYGIEDVENITLVTDPKHEGLSRGFAFLEFSCHPDAMLAYKRLQKPDVVFGHTERTAKVAFAEPLREPDPEIMAQVKSVFIDGLPPHWDEDRVREKFKSFGEITRITLARNMSTAKRKDFGFVDFTTHDAAVACVNGINNTELGDGNLKNKVRARLSNPSPKIQAVKGGMCGGFRIGGRSSSGNFPRFGRGFGRGGHSFSRASFQYRRGFDWRGPGTSGRMGSVNEPALDGPHPSFYGRQNFARGGRWGFAQPPMEGPMPERPNLDRHGLGAFDRGHNDRNFFRAQPFPPEEEFNRAFAGRHFEDPYLYDEISRGTKRPFFARDQGRDYMEPSRLRPRLDYADGSISSGSQYRDALGAGPSYYSRDYYGAEYDGGAYSSYRGVDRGYGRGNYY